MTRDSEAVPPTSVDELVKSVRVSVDDMVEEVDTDPGAAPDTRLPQPDRDWFNAGG